MRRRPSFRSNIMPVLTNISVWAQQGGAGELIWGLIIFCVVIFQAVRAFLEARAAQTTQQAEKEKPPLAMEPKKERKRPRQTLSIPPEEASDRKEKNDRPHRKALSRELAPQGEGARFDAAPGTFDEAKLVASSIEPTVKPTLESMTGIYEASPTSSELPDQPLTLDIQKLIARPDGIRQAILLAEILKRPEELPSFRGYENSQNIQGTSTTQR